MKRLSPSVLLSLLVGCAAVPKGPPASSSAPLAVERGQALLGTWTGALEVRGHELGIALHFTEAGGAIGGSLGVPAQAVKALPLDVVSLEGTTLHLEARLPQTGQQVGFDGQLDGARAQGTFTQGAAKVPFRLQRGARAAVRAEPRSTDQYTEELVTVSNGTATLAGTLTVPRGASRPPAVVLISGSGPQDRNETVVGVPIFGILADALARHGVAVLRLDDRGFAESTGDFHAATTLDFASDAQAAVAFLRVRGTFERVGLLGHSEGGVIAPLVASKDPSIAFVVLLAPPTVPFAQVLDEQVELIGRAEGHPAPAAEVELQHRIYAAVKQGTVAALAKEAPPQGIPEASYRAAMAEASLPWFQWLVKYDPAPALEALRCPTLALFGSRDLQVPPASNALPLDRLAQAGGADVTVQVLPELNHLFQRAKTGAPSEYATLAKTVDETMVRALTGWLATHATR